MKEFYRIAVPYTFPTNLLEKYCELLRQIFDDERKPLKLYILAMAMRKTQMDIHEAVLESEEVDPGVVERYRELMQKQILELQNFMGHNSVQLSGLLKAQQGDVQ